MNQVSGEWRRFPAPRVMLEAETVVISAKRRQTGDGVIVDKNAEEATLGLHRDVSVIAEGVDGGSEMLSFTGSLCAAVRAFGLQVSPRSMRRGQAYPQLAAGSR